MKKKTKLWESVDHTILSLINYFYDIINALLRKLERLSGYRLVGLE